MVTCPSTCLMRVAGTDLTVRLKCEQPENHTTLHAGAGRATKDGELWGINYSGRWSDAMEDDRE